MIIARSRSELDTALSAWRAKGETAAFVPTMGALHDGHLALVALARKNAARCIVSIFVNPTQFAPHEDFAAYPRDEAGDLEKLRRAGTDLVYLPHVQDIYPGGPAPDRRVEGLAAQGLESVFRPHFFDGVVSVVHRLFDQIKPSCAVFGEKDYQQLCVIREMAGHYHSHIKIIGAPVIRDAGGLALSSRNAYLSPAQLKIAQRLNKILFAAAKDIRIISSSRRKPGSYKVELDEDPGFRRDDAIEKVLDQAKSEILTAGFSAVQYLELREDDTLRTLSAFDPAKNKGRILVAALLDQIRLIDNVPV